MIRPKIINSENYIFKNYTILNNEEQKLALKFRNENKDWMINTENIQLDNHIRWIQSLSKDMTTLYYLVFKNNVPFMSINFHDINLNKKEAYWGYFLGNQEYKSEVLKIEKEILRIAFDILGIDVLLCINAIDNHVIDIHRFFGFKEVEIITIDGRDFLKMYLNNNLKSIK